MDHAGLRRFLWLPALCLLLLSPAPARAAVSAEELSKLKKEMRLVAQARDAARMSGLIQRLAGMDDPGTAAILVEAAVTLPSSRNYDTALKALAKFSGEKTIEELVKLCKKEEGDFRGRVLILGAFGQRRDEATRAAVHASIEDKVPVVQVAAIHACRSRKERESIPVLIDLVAKSETGRNRAWIEAREALLALTGQDYQTVEDWRKFWEAKKDSIDPAKLDQGKGPTKIVIKKAKDGDSVEFFGHEILSQNVVFVIDCSGSMILYDDDPAFKGKNIEYERKRLKRAQDQCILAVRKLKGRSRFNIITYNDRVFTWQKGIVGADSSNIAAAVKYIKKFQANGWTHTDEALEKAFQDPGLDTIVLLSDGAPAKEGNLDSTGLQKKILDRVKDLNSSRKLRIDTFGFEGEGRIPRSRGGGSVGSPPGGGGGDSLMVQFLKELAKQNGGEYRSIK